MVAHRLSTIRKADQIVVMQNGMIVEIGNHNSLMEKKGRYFQLVQSQLDLSSTIMATTNGTENSNSQDVKNTESENQKALPETVETSDNEGK